MLTTAEAISAQNSTMVTANMNHSGVDYHRVETSAFVLVCGTDDLIVRFIA